jgi:hypothetical protein
MDRWYKPCYYCLAGQHQPSCADGFGTCTTCAAGQFSGEGVGTCTASCPTGTYISGTIACTACAAGQFSATVGAVICSFCGAGNYTASTPSAEELADTS